MVDEDGVGRFYFPVTCQIVDDGRVCAERLIYQKEFFRKADRTPLRLRMLFLIVKILQLFSKGWE
jgi:hypothetical protein